MEGTTLVTVAVIIILVSLWLSSGKRSLKRLPGPWTNGLPIVGSLPILGSKPFLKLTELSEKYGPVYRLRLGSIDVVILADFAGMKEAFAKDAFIGRPPDLPFEFSQDTIDQTAELVREAIGIIEQHTRFTFREEARVPPKGLKIIAGSSYYAQGSLIQQPLVEISLKNGNTPLNMILPELCHSLGLIHEHQRNDRDWYVEILRSNVIAGNLSQFRKKIKSQYFFYYHPYDSSSILHYSRFAFAKPNTVTIRRANGPRGVNVPDNQPTELSALDIQKLRAL